MDDVEANIILAINFGWTSVSVVILWAVLNDSLFLHPKHHKVCVKFTTWNSGQRSVYW